MRHEQRREVAQVSIRRPGAKMFAGVFRVKSDRQPIMLRPVFRLSVPGRNFLFRAHENHECLQTESEGLV